MRVARPLIGMPARMDPGEEKQYLSRQYADAVITSGGVPLILPLVESPDLLSPVVDMLDGILLTGSASDLNPASYGAERRPECGPGQELRDRTDFFLLDAATRKRVPVLAICYGLQSLNVHRGGSLHQDIASDLNTGIRHSQPETKGDPAHRVQFSPGSLLEELGASNEAAVNSTHHQAIDRLGSGLQVIAQASDGIIEAVVGKETDRWVLGVQWHPERSYSHDPLSRKIFDRFIESCRTTGRIHEGADC